VNVVHSKLKGIVHVIDTRTDDQSVVLVPAEVVNMNIISDVVFDSESKEDLAHVQNRLMIDQPFDYQTKAEYDGTILEHRITTTKLSGKRYKVGLPFNDNAEQANHKNCGRQANVVRSNAKEYWVRMFSWLYARNLNLKLASDLSDKTCIKVMKRLLVDHSQLRYILSDKGTQFDVADQMMRKFQRSWLYIHVLQLRKRHKPPRQFGEDDGDLRRESTERGPRRAIMIDPKEGEIVLVWPENEENHRLQWDMEVIIDTHKDPVGVMGHEDVNTEEERVLTRSLLNVFPLELSESEPSGRSRETAANGNNLLKMIPTSHPICVLSPHL